MRATEVCDDIDINRDGFKDILLGAHGNDDGGTDAGKGYLLLSGL